MSEQIGNASGMDEQRRPVVRNKHFRLAVVLFGLLITRPIIADVVVNSVFLGALMFSAWVAAEGYPRVRWGLVILAAPVLAVMATFHDSDELSQGFYGYFVAFSIIALLLYCGWLVLWALLRTRRVGLNEILGTVNLYLIIGFTWSYIYSALEMLRPHSFNFADAEFEMGAKFIYFSFVTLTTLGYGEITPRTEAAAMIASIEAIVGQLYIAVVIAYLLSIFTTQNINRH